FAGSPTDIFCGGTAGVREDSLSDGTKGNILSELGVLSLGAVGGTRPPGGDPGRPKANHTCMETGRPAGVFESAGGTGRPHCDFHFRRGAAGTRAGGVVCRHWH